MKKPIGTREKISYILGGLIVACMMAGVVMLYLKPVPEINKEAILTAMNKIEDAFFIVVAYFFGSSLGSREKTEILNKHAQDKIENTNNTAAE